MSIAQRLIMGYSGSGGGGSSDPSFANVKLLAHFDGSDGATSATDTSSVGSTISFFGNAQLDTANKVFGTASLQLDGSGDYVSIGSTSTFAFMHQPSAIWTFECRVKFNAFSGTQCIFSTATGPSTDHGVIIYVTSGRGLNFDIYRGVSGAWVVAGAFSTLLPNDTDWHSIMVTWDHTLGSNNAELYVDGTLYGQMTKTANTPSSSNSTQAGRIGAYGASSYLNGYIDEVRITNLERRQTSNYTPDSSAFPDS